MASFYLYEDINIALVTYIVRQKVEVASSKLILCSLRSISIRIDFYHCTVADRVPSNTG
jgi:hypothetical protein